MEHPLSVPTVSPEQRARMRRQAAALAVEETCDEGSPEWRAAMVKEIDRRRARRGIPPLEPWWIRKGEQELHRRARALGLLRAVR